MNNITRNLFLLFITLVSMNSGLLNAQNNSEQHNSIKSKLAISPKPPMPSIDGTYELKERIMADGTVLRPPTIEALYTLDHGRFNLNLFIKNKDGTISSESTIGRYTFSNNQYCEWIDYTIRNNLDKPGITYEAPVVIDHCTTVTKNNDEFSFSPPGEGVLVNFGSDGFTAKIGGEFVDHWKKLK